MEERFPWCNSTVEFQLDYQTAASAATKPAASHVDIATKSVSSHHESQLHRPRRRRSWISSLGFSNLQTVLLASVCLILWCSPCLAAAITVGETATSSLLYGEIIYDRSPPPLPHVRLIKRSNNAASSSSTTTKSSATGTSTASSTSQTSALPSPFDSSLGNNFTASSCPAFFSTFLSDSAFNECIPLSLLLQTSNSFFTVEQSPVRLVQTLDATCNVNFTACSAVMKGYARQLQLTSNCGADLQAQNPTVMQAYSGLAAYDAMYHAGCLQNSETGNYCFSDAVTNSSAPTSSYIYYLALGISLPASTKASCNTCLQNTMAVFANSATNSSQPVSDVYVDGAELVDQSCGADFVNATVATGASGSSGSGGGAGSATSSAAAAGRAGARLSGFAVVGLGFAVGLVALV